MTDGNYIIIDDPIYKDGWEGVSPSFALEALRNGNVTIINMNLNRIKQMTDETTINLSSQDAKLVADMLENPPPPNEKLKAAIDKKMGRGFTEDVLITLLTVFALPTVWMCGWLVFNVLKRVF